MDDALTEGPLSAGTATSHACGWSPGIEQVFCMAPPSSILAWQTAASLPTRIPETHCRIYVDLVLSTVGVGPLTRVQSSSWLAPLSWICCVGGGRQGDVQLGWGLVAGLLIGAAGR